eukprot:gene17806-24859_t
MNLHPLRALRVPAALIGLLLAGAASAHTGTDASSHHGFITGFLHPFTGLDHLAAMLGVGLWSALAARTRDRRLLWAPCGFAALLLVGALVGWNGAWLPAVEPLIAASVLLVGLLAASRLSMPGPAAALLVGFFAWFHGLAHGIELGGSAVGAASVFGVMVGTLCLQAIGLGLGLALRQRSIWLPRLLGGGVAVFGMALLGGWA